MYSFSKEASNTKEAADKMQAVLDETERAQSVATDALQLAQNNTNATRELLSSVSLTSDLQSHGTVWSQWE